VSPHSSANVDQYARARLRRTLRSINAHGGCATPDELEALRECYAQLNNDTWRVCAGRRAPHDGRRRYARSDS
jgi:hypothetical protein